MAIPIIIIGVIAYAKKQLPLWLIMVWVFVPSLLFLITSIISVGYAHSVAGMIQLIVNLLILIYTTKIKPKNFRTDVFRIYK